MEEQSDTLGSEAAENQETVSAPETGAGATEKTSGDSLEEALKRAIEHHEPRDAQDIQRPSKPDGVRKAPESVAQKPAEVTNEEDIPAPSEFNAQEKEAWARGDRKGIASAWQRVNTSRLGAINNLTNENQRLKSAKPPVEDDDPRVRLVAALKADPVKSIHEIMKVRGITKEQLFAPETEQRVAVDSNISAVQNEISEIRSQLQEQKQRELADNFRGVFDKLQGEKDAAGNQKYADLVETEEGYRLAGAIGSLAVRPDFQAAVRFKNPGAGLVEFAEAAYQLLGGRVNEADSPRSQENKQTQIRQATRARISSPGKAPGVQRVQASNKKFDSLEGALAAAYADHEGE